MIFERVNDMAKTVLLLMKEDCYCELLEFYEHVAHELGVKTTADVRFDCRSICVSPAVIKEIRSYYRNELGANDEEISALLLIYGPKANVTESDASRYRVEVKEGFLLSPCRRDL